MRRIAVLAMGLLVLAACGSVLDNIEISIDGKQIFADSCQDLADSIAETVDEKLAEVDANTETDLPDVDVAGIIGRADDLGCSPEELEALVDRRLADVDAASDKARGFLDGLRDQFASDAG